MAGSELDLLRKYLFRAAAYLTMWLAGQTVGAIWWASAINTRVHQLERVSERVEARVHHLELRPCSTLSPEPD